MNNFYFIGVDVSKKKLDFCVLFENKVIHEEVVSNHSGAIKSLIHQLERDLGIDNAQMLVCAEHTGKYTYPLICACESIECKLWLEHPSNIKYSSGVQRDFSGVKKWTKAFSKSDKGNRFIAGLQ